MADDSKNAWNSFTEEIEVSGQQLMAELNRLLAEGNVRKLQIRSEGGDIFLTVPLTAGVVAGGVVAIAAPWLAIIGAVAGLVGNVKIEILREAQPSKVAAPAQPGDTGTGAAPDDKV